MEDTYSETDDEYNDLIERLNHLAIAIDTEWLLDITNIDSEFYEFIVFDESDSASRYLEEYPDAYDENLDFFAEIAMNRASDEYSTMKDEIENSVFKLRDEIYSIVSLLSQTHEEITKFFNK